MFCTKCGAQIPDGAKFCTRCGASVADDDQPAGSNPAMDDAQPVADPFADDIQAAAPQAAPAPAAPAEQALAANKKPDKKRRVIAVVAGLAIVAAIGGAVVVVPRLNAADAVTSGGKGAVACSVETRVIPKDKSGKKLSSYTAELVPVSGEGKSYRIRVKGDDGFAMSDFGKLPNKKYKMVITSGKGKKARAMTMKVDYNKNNGDAKKSIDLTQSKAEAKAKASAAEQTAAKTANELFADKICEYQKKYGEGQAVDSGNSYYCAQGVAYAKLIDFDGDGQDELLIEYSTDPLENRNGADAAKAEVWAYRNGKIEKVYEPDVQVDPSCVAVWLRVFKYDGTYGFKRFLHNGKKVNFKDTPVSMMSTDGYQCELDSFDGKSFGATLGPVGLSDSKLNDISAVSDLDAEFTADESTVNKTIATVSATLDQLKSSDGKSDDSEQQASYEATTATQDVDFTAPAGEGTLDPNETTQITATWTYPQVNGTGLGVTKFNQAMQQQVSDALAKSKEAKANDDNSRVTQVYNSQIVSIDGDIACVRTYTSSYRPPYRAEHVTRSAFYNLKTGEQATLEDSLAQHNLSFDTLKDEAKAAIKAAKPDMDSATADKLDDDGNDTEDHFYFDGKGYIVVLDTGVFDSMAWDTHDLVAHPIDSSYSVGQDVTPSRK